VAEVENAQKTPKPKKERPLLTRFIEAVDKGHAQTPFSTKDLKNWVAKYKITKDGINEYAENTLDTALCNAYLGKRKSKNKNVPFLDRRPKEGDGFVYWVPED